MNVEKNARMLVLCDFDGTICTVDMGNEILNRFTGKGWDEIDRAYIAGEIGSREAYTQAASIFKGSMSQMLEFVEVSERMDPYFPEFYRFCRGKGIDLKIASDGLDFYIEAILTKHNLQEIEFFSNVVVFRNSDVFSIEFPSMNDQCEKCGTCKSGVLKDNKKYYDLVVYVGNGYSDVCPSKDADLVFAKDVLYDNCRQNGTACIHYKNFKDVNDFLEKRVF